MKVFTALGLISLTALSGLIVAADSGWYAGNAGITTRLLPDGLETSSIVDDDTRLGYKAFGGYHFGGRFALEGGYFDLGKYSYVTTSVPAGTLRGVIKLHGRNLNAIGVMPLTGGLSSFPRTGVSYMETKANFSGTGAVNPLISNRHPHTANFKFGLGLQYDLIEALTVRAEVERFRIDDAMGNKGDIDLLSFRFVYRPGSARRGVAAAPASPWTAPPR